MGNTVGNIQENKEEPTSISHYDENKPGWYITHEVVVRDSCHKAIEPSLNSTTIYEDSRDDQLSFADRRKPLIQQTSFQSSGKGIHGPVMTSIAYGSLYVSWYFHG